MTKILIIEDDPTMQRLYQHAFQLAGYGIDSAKDGSEGLEKVKQFVPDLIFLDIMMPNMNGIQVLDVLKKDAETKDIPVVMLTNITSGTLETAELAVKMGAVRYVIKSEKEPKEMIAIAEEILKKEPSSCE